MLVEFGDAPSRNKKVATTIACYESCHRRMIFLTEPDDHVLDGGHTFTFKVAYGATQYLRQIEH